MQMLDCGIQRNRLLYGETPNRKTTQFGNMGKRS